MKKGDPVMMSRATQWWRTRAHKRLFSTIAILCILLSLVTLGMLHMGPSKVRAAGYCQVTYTVTNQWQGGFGANIVIQNTGSSAWTSWTLTFTFPASGQAVTQGWNGTFAQSGQNVTVTNVSYNSSVAVNGTVNPGFNGAWTSSNPVPTSFSVNGNTCGGTTVPTNTPGSTNTPAPTNTPTGPTPTNTPANSQPCDIYATGGTPCVAAHSTVRALYASYSGNLYQVRRSSDNTTKDIGVLSVGGYANSATQDSFCSGTSCVITIIYDQSGRGNNLTQAPGGGAAGGPDNLANATALSLTVGGHKVYGVYIPAGTGYRNDKTSGVATGDNPEGEYAIFDGTHYNGGCCFDYGNAETSNNDTGNGHMEAIYFGNIKVWGYGSGNGPWVMADLENGLFSGVNAGFNSGDQSITSHYVTAMVKGGPNLWAIKAGNAQSGGLTTMYNGQRPNVSGYNPMHKEGAIILGIGGDNSKGAAGTFFEGAMTSGYPSDATENAIQANIVAAGY
jgi:non-reducing end alpha-L-arabinofuranosidase